MIPRKLPSILLALLLLGCAPANSAARIMPQSYAAQSCATAVPVMCIAVTMTPGASATPTRGSIFVTPSATPSPTALATVTATREATPTAIVPGPTWSPGPSPTPAPVRYGLYSPNFQQRVRAGPGINNVQVAWIGGGTTWAVWAEGSTVSGDLWLFIEDRARAISGWVAYRYQGVLYGTYTLDNH